MKVGAGDDAGGRVGGGDDALRLCCKRPERRPTPPMRGKVRIYLASPRGCSEAGRHFYTGVLVPAVRALGYDVLDPWSLTDARKILAVQRRPYGRAKRTAWRKLNMEMGDTNRAAIDRAGLVLAVLDGTDVDS